MPTRISSTRISLGFPLLLHVDDFFGSFLGDPYDFRVQDQIHPFRQESVLHDSGGVRVFPGKDVGPHLEEGHPASEAAECLVQLAPDRPAADDGEPPGKFGQGEDRLVGEAPRFLDLRDRRSRRPCPRADGGPLEPEALAVHFDGVGSGKSPLAQKDIDAQLFGIPVDGVVEADVRPDPPHPLHRFPEIDGQALASSHYEFPGGARIVDCPGRP